MFAGLDCFSNKVYYPLYRDGNIELTIKPSYFNLIVQWLFCFSDYGQIKLLFRSLLFLFIYVRRHSYTKVVYFQANVIIILTWKLNKALKCRPS